MVELLVNEPDTQAGVPGGAPTFVLAHGAGAPMVSAFLETVAMSLASSGVRVVRFEFPYMAARRDGQKPGPDREPILRQTWLSVIEQLGGGPSVFIGGKSMGGRIASLVADEAGARGLVCLGYPFHPPGQPEKLRTRHLAALRTPTLIVQGSRDPFGTREDVATYALSPAIRVLWIEGGDHSFATRRKKGPETAGGTRGSQEGLSQAIDAVRDFLSATAGSP